MILLYWTLIFLQQLLTKSSDPMTIFFTSGTTGEPKMTEHTFASYGLAAQITGRLVSAKD